MPTSTKKAVCAGYLHLCKKNIGDDDVLRKASCEGPADTVIDDKYYCVMHAPTKEKTGAFETALRKRLKARNYNFVGAWFPAALDLSDKHFESDVHFSGACFNDDVVFKRTRFTCENAYFDAAKFKSDNAIFDSAQFDCRYISFHKAKFNSSELSFKDAVFKGYELSFSRALLKGFFITFTGAVFKTTYVRFENTLIDCESISFSNARFNNEDETSFRKTRFRRGNAQFNETKFNSFTTNFTQAYFGENVSFERARFAGGRTYFGKTHFKQDVRFQWTEFVGQGHIYFGNARFAGTANFERAVFDQLVYFKAAYFAGVIECANTRFEKPVFFEDTIFDPTAFADFRFTVFKDSVKFYAIRIYPGAEFYFGEAIIDVPERFSFNSIAGLAPRWFINTDCGKLKFDNSSFKYVRGKTPTSKTELLKMRKMLQRVQSLRIWESEHEEKEFSYRVFAATDGLLTIACGRLAANAEENNRYEEAAFLRFMAMDVHRLSRNNGRSFWTLHWWYWFSSGYGESSWRAFAVLLAIWLVFAGLYLLPVSNFYRWETRMSNSEDYQTAIIQNKIDTEGRSLNVAEAFSYSFGVMSLQKPEPKPLGTVTFALVALETALGPVQAALLALAIRRKFMR